MSEWEREIFEDERTLVTAFDVLRQLKNPSSSEEPGAGGSQGPQYSG